MTIHGITFLIERDGCVLLEKCPKKRKVIGLGEWFVPGGKVEPDEVTSDTLVRESKEELGIEVINWKPFPVVEGSPVSVDITGLFLMRPYHITHYKGDIPTHTLDEGVELRWVPIDEALNSHIPQVRMMTALLPRLNTKTVHEELRIITGRYFAVRHWLRLALQLHDSDVPMDRRRSFVKEATDALNSIQYPDPTSTYPWILPVEHEHCGDPSCRLCGNPLPDAVPQHGGRPMTLRECMEAEDTVPVQSIQGAVHIPSRFYSRGGTTSGYGGGTDYGRMEHDCLNHISQAVQAMAGADGSDELSRLHFEAARRLLDQLDGVRARIYDGIVNATSNTRK